MNVYHLLVQMVVHVSRILLAFIAVIVLQGGTVPTVKQVRNVCGIKNNMNVRTLVSNRSFWFPGDLGRSNIPPNHGSLA